MIHDPGTNGLIRWSDIQDDTVYISDVAAFSEKVLPHYFAHSNWPSFVRQLNIYGFRRVKDDSSRGSDSYQFAHEEFTRNGEQQLHLIKRKAQGSSMTTTHAAINTSGDTNAMERLDTLFQRLSALESECKVVVSETQTLHSIYAQQQQILACMLDLLQELNTHPDLAEVQRKLQSALEIANLRVNPLAAGAPTTPLPLMQQLPSIAEAVRTAKETTDLPPLHDSTHDSFQ
ncbi:winged helix DNA-binding domain-containing protein [Lichtheimia hyalospora FSU 10163]|nr:winged helix DNA-binding domain-containing protein [Lichtheimia hyalospora FSU 10163]